MPENSANDKQQGPRGRSGGFLPAEAVEEVISVL